MPHIYDSHQRTAVGRYTVYGHHGYSHSSVNSRQGLGGHHWDAPGSNSGSQLKLVKM